MRGPLTGAALAVANAIVCCLAMVQYFQPRTLKVFDQTLATYATVAALLIVPTVIGMVYGGFAEVLEDANIAVRYALIAPTLTIIALVVIDPRTAAMLLLCVPTLVALVILEQQARNRKAAPIPVALASKAYD